MKSHHVAEIAPISLLSARRSAQLDSAADRRLTIKELERHDDPVRDLLRQQEAWGTDDSDEPLFRLLVYVVVGSMVLIAIGKLIGAF